MLTLSKNKLIHSTNSDFFHIILIAEGVLFDRDGEIAGIGPIKIGFEQESIKQRLRLANEKFV